MHSRHTVPLADSFHEPAPNLLAARLGSDIQALHLAGFRIQRAQRDGANRPRAVPCEEQSPGRWLIFAGQVSQLPFKILKLQIDAQVVGVLSEKCANDLEVSWQFGRSNVCHHLV